VEHGLSIAGDDGKPRNGRYSALYISLHSVAFGATYIRQSYQS